VKCSLIHKPILDGVFGEFVEKDESQGNVCCHEASPLHSTFPLRRHHFLSLPSTVTVLDYDSLV
jgi:hypothetical protein